MSSPRPKPTVSPRSTAAPSPAPPESGGGTSPEDQEEPEQDADLPLTMAASVVLTSLPKDAHEALQSIGKEAEGEKGECAIQYSLSPRCDCHLSSLLDFVGNQFQTTIQYQYQCQKL